MKFGGDIFSKGMVSIPPFEVSIIEQGFVKSFQDFEWTCVLEFDTHIL
jgi:hypothetical protein